MNAPKCPFLPPPTPEVCGYLTMEALEETVLSFPHLRPCALRPGNKGTWQWINKTACAKCEASKGHP